MQEMCISTGRQSERLITVQSQLTPGLGLENHACFVGHVQCAFIWHALQACFVGFVHCAFIGHGHCPSSISTGKGTWAWGGRMGGGKRDQPPMHACNCLTTLSLLSLLSWHHISSMPTCSGLSFFLSKYILF